MIVTRAVAFLVFVCSLGHCQEWNNSCTPKYAASSLQVSLTGAVTPVWLYKNSHEEALNLPDFHPVAYRTADGQCHLSITHYENYRISGQTLSSLKTTQKTFDSDKVTSAEIHLDSDGGDIATIALEN